MPFRKRTTQAEYFDDPARSISEIAAGYRQLARVNRLFRLDDVYTRLLTRWLGEEHCAELSILDLGAGDGWLGNRIQRWARQRGWNWRVTHLDLSASSLHLNEGSRKVVGCALALPFAENSFDVVIASQMTHHLTTDEEAVRHLREAHRVAARGVFISDARRSLFLYAVLWVVLRVLRLSPEMVSDGLLSVRRCWRLSEWRDLADRAGFGGTVHNYFGARVILAARKTLSLPADTASETSATYPAADEFCSAPFGR
jgi:ubiquinone/menaquinone biosynthesis C-methylase UbiE